MPRLIEIIAVAFAALVVVFAVVWMSTEAAVEEVTVMEHTGSVR